MSLIGAKIGAVLGILFSLWWAYHTPREDLKHPQIILIIMAPIFSAMVAGIMIEYAIYLLLYVDQSIQNWKANR